MMVNVGIVGAGYWGPNLVRNFMACELTRVVAVCDRDRARLDRVLKCYPTVDPVEDVDALLGRADVDAVAVATPAETHHPITMAALEAGKHVLVEKPMAGSLQEALAMTRAAEARRRVLMIDHTYVYSQAVRAMKRLIDVGEIGTIQYVDCARMNLGLFNNHTNVVWDLAPHDLSILDFLLGRMPRSVSAFGSCHTPTGEGTEDIAYLRLEYGDGLLASIHVNWLSPVKVRHFIVGGSRKSIIYDDLERDEKVKLYDRGVDMSFDADRKRRVLISYRMGDVLSPRIEHEEPLFSVVRHFAECIRDGTPPLSDGAAGLRVMRILDAAQRSLAADGARVPL